ncbi:methyltransferase domain-containing protein, partial [Candidatus Poribacteria bacterium]|nr:methyltransferase domain-containing protein [Candidatus Poribacteria bacterium]
MALRVGRHRTEAARRAEAGAGQVLLSVHRGEHHLEFFRDQMPQLIGELPQNFQALEIGAGMAWHAALLAAHGTGSVFATEVSWEGKTPFHRDNAATFWRLAEREPRLRAVLEFERAPDGDFAAVRFNPRIQFARADAHALPVADASLDFVYSINCLEHIPRVGESFREVAR